MGLVAGSTVQIVTSGDLAGGNILIASQAVSTTGIAGGKNHWTMTSTTTQLGGTVAAGGDAVLAAKGPDHSNPGVQRVLVATGFLVADVSRFGHQ